MLNTMDFDFVAATLDKYGLSDRFDAGQVLLKMGGRRPGKHCVGKAGGKGSYISAEKQCAGHKGADGKLTAIGKQSARELAARVRDRKGLSDTMAVKVARMPLREFLEPIKGVHTEKQLAPMFRKHHKEVRAELNKRRINSGREAIVDKKAPRSPKSTSVNPEYKDLKGPQIKAAKLLAKDILADPQKEKTVAAALREHAGKAQQESLSPEQRQASMDLHGIYSTAFAIVDKKRIANMKYSNRNRKDSATPAQQTSRVRRLNR